jgi:two-component system, sensor histidine kinase PhcS
MNKELYSGYEEEIRGFRIKFSRGGAYTGIALILLGVGLDYGLYPHMQFPFATTRAFVSLLIFLVILLLKTTWGKDRVRYLTFFWLFLPQLMINWMIAVTDGAASLYSVGLYLAIFASSIALAFNLLQNLALGILSIVLYVAACSIHPETFVLHGSFLVNVMLLTFVVMVSGVCTFFNEQTRFILFKLKSEISGKNKQLEQINKNLSEIKGQMLQQEKMAAIGTLASGLLHEVNNPVNFCLMAIEVGLEEPVVKTSETLTECLVDARDGMRRIQNIVSDLKTFAYRKSEAVASGGHFLFEKALDSAIRLTGHELKSVAVSRSLPDDTLVRGDEAAIIGVLINLLSNAVLALRNLKTQTAPAIDISATWDGDGGRLRIAIRDNGPGIAAENLARVFEPFFTTREIGQGLGLGLSISYGVIERHGSTLVAESVVGEWTQMIFDLPRAE